MKISQATQSNTGLITSPDNALFKKALSLNSSRGLKKHQHLLVPGEKLITEYLETTREITKDTFLFCRKDHLISGDSALCKLTQQKQIKTLFLTADLFNELNEVGTPGPILMSSFKDLCKWQEPVEAKQKKTNSSHKSNRFRVLLPLKDPLNLGAAIRTAVAFGADDIILLQEAAHPYLPKSIRSSAGAVFKAQLLAGPSISELKQAYLYLDAKGYPITDYDWKKERPFDLLVGEEGQGIPGLLKGKALSIPTVGVESLNAANALAIALFERARKLSGI